MAESLVKTLVGILPIFVLLPAIQQLISKIQAGTFQLTDIFNIILPLVLVSALTEAIR